MTRTLLLNDRGARDGLAEERLRRVSRARSIVAACMHALVRASAERSVLQEICELVVGHGGHRSAWIGFAAHDEEKSVAPVASAGIALDALHGLRLTWADRPTGRGAVGTALRTRRTRAIDDYFAQADFAAWRDFARVHGFRSGIALPLVLDDSTCGVLMINSPEVRRFDGEEIALLEELADDIAFGIRSLRAGQRRAQAEQALRDTLENMAQGISLMDSDLRFIAWNQRFRDLLEIPQSLCRVGVAFEELARYNALRGDYGPGDPEEQVRVRVALAKRFEPHCFERVRPNGTVLEIRGMPAPGGGFVTTYTDITDRRRAEAALRESEEQLRQLAGNIPEAYWIEDVASESLLYLSPAFTRITGWRLAAGADLQQTYDIVHAEDCKRVLAAAGRSRLGGFDEQYRIVRPDGTARWVHTRTFAIKNAQGKVYRLAGVTEDISEKMAADERLEQMALYDTLTSLPNRTLFYRNVQQTLERAKRGGGTAALMFLDLDRFKNVNDTLGHAVGDELLRQVATRLVKALRVRDTLGRLGGDEFAILLSNLVRAEDAGLVAAKVLRVLAEPFTLEGHEMFVTASIGIALAPADGDDPDALIRAADTAMYRAKKSGRNNARFFKAKMNEHALERLQLEAQLRRALERDEFLLHYQPKLHLADSRLSGAEALLRWNHPVRGLVSPADFVPLLEETGMIVPVGAWVVREVCRQLRAWRDAGLPAMRVAINLSPRQFAQKDLAASVRLAAHEAGINPQWLEFEITESTLMSHADETVAILKGLRDADCALSVDDFGTGYSSLSYLKRFPIDNLKIDRSFIRDVTSDADDAAIVRAIIGMAHDLNLKVVAEGVESEAQLEFLRERHCDEIQGYLLSRPVDAAAFAGLVRTFAARRRHSSEPVECHGRTAALHVAAAAMAGSCQGGFQ